MHGRDEWAGPINDELDRLERAYLRTNLCTVTRIDHYHSADEVFHRDVAAWLPHGHLVCNMRHNNRQGEPSRWINAIYTGDTQAITKLERTKSWMNIEGADLLWVEPDLLLCGIGERTAAGSYASLVEMLRLLGVHVIPVVLPLEHDQHLLGVMNVLHPRSGETLVIACQDVIDMLTWRSTSRDRKWFNECTCKALARWEVEDKATNVVQIGNTIFINRECSYTIEKLNEYGFNVMPVKCEELMKYGGGPACATGYINCPLTTCTAVQEWRREV